MCHVPVALHDSFFSVHVTVMQIGSTQFRDAAVRYLSSTYVYISSGYPVMPMNLIKPSSFNFCNAGIVSFTICSSGDFSTRQAMPGTYKTASGAKLGACNQRWTRGTNTPLSMTFYPARRTTAQHQ